MNILSFPDSWLEPLDRGFCLDFLRDIESKLIPKNDEKVSIFPPNNLIFRALDLVCFEDAKVLILGQDPYHGFGQANGLSFSVNKTISIPPSLKNIFLELKNDLDVPISPHGDLTYWAQQKVLLLNSALTVERGKPNSHKKLGWEKLTDKIINQLSDRGNMIFVLWGKSAQKKYTLIDQSIINFGSLSSILSAYKGFFGCKHFSKINKILKQRPAR